MSQPVHFTGRKKFVWVEWQDAASHNTGWQEWGTVPLTEEPCVSVGWLIEESPERILLSATISPEGTNSHFSIPRPMITRLVELDIPDPV